MAKFFAVFAVQKNLLYPISTTRKPGSANLAGEFSKGLSIRDYAFINIEGVKLAWLVLLINVFKFEQANT